MLLLATIQCCIPSVNTQQSKNSINMRLVIPTLPCTYPKEECSQHNRILNIVNVRFHCRLNNQKQPICKMFVYIHYQFKWAIWTKNFILDEEIDVISTEQNRSTMEGLRQDTMLK